MTATECNMAYRTADHERWRQMDFVKGIEIRVSATNHGAKDTDICDELQGIYPKDFKWTGWHPNCRCNAVAVMEDFDTMLEKQQEYIEGGEKPDYSEGEVKELPSNFTKWVERNGERIKGAKSLPYFLADNGKIKGGKYVPTDFGKTTAKAVKEVAEEATKEVAEVAKELTPMQQLAKDLGVDEGKPMTHEEADHNHPNPHFADDEQYRINCQSCVVAYEMRLRGLSVEAYGSTKGSTSTLLRTNTRAAWVNAEGKPPRLIVCRQAVNGRTVDRLGRVRVTKSTESDVINAFMDATSAVGRYHVQWNWKGTRKGHIITMETFKDGTRRFYDPQTGKEAKSILPWIKGRRAQFNIKAGIGAYRVDDMQPNDIIVRGVLKKSGSKAVTPSLTAEQKAWWKKNVGEVEGVTDGLKSMPILTKKDVDVVLKNGGSISVHPSRIKNANVNKQERAKFTKEQRMCNVLANNGYKIEMLEEVAGVSSADIIINGLKADLKSTKGAGNIVKYGKKAISEQNADIVIFEFEEMNLKIHQEINKLRNINIHGMYIVKGSNKIVKF